jgi:shikimate dehydrogenase
MKIDSNIDGVVFNDNILFIIYTMSFNNVSGLYCPQYICAIIGQPIAHSLSPRMHNAAYQHYQLPYVYLPFEIAPANLEVALMGARALGVKGLSVTIPFKEAVLPYLDYLDPLADKIGAVNTIVFEAGKLHGYNTDAQGVIVPLINYITLKGAEVLIFGSGGAARAAAFAVIDQGANATICARNSLTAEKIIKDLPGLKYLESNALVSLDVYDVIINATPVGMNNDAPFDLNLLTSEKIVFDMVYKPRITPLLNRAVEVEAVAIGGVEMLLNQGYAQFKLFTGLDAPQEVMRIAITL